MSRLDHPAVVGLAMVRDEIDNALAALENACPQCRSRHVKDYRLSPHRDSYGVQRVQVFKRCLDCDEIYDLGHETI